MGCPHSKSRRIQPNQPGVDREAKGKLQPGGETKDTKIQPAPMEDRLKNLERALEASQEESRRTGQRAITDRQEFQAKLTSVESALVTCQHENAKLKSDLERNQLVNAAKTDPSMSKLDNELRLRDDKIIKLSKEISLLNAERNNEMVMLNKKMELVMDEKDHQIKRLNALGNIAVDGKRDGNLRTAISAEASRKLASSTKLPKIQKTAAEREDIEQALMDNAFMRNLSRDQLQQIIDAMEKKTYQASIEIIREGMDGTHMYILQKGRVQVTKGNGSDKTTVCSLTSGSLFGELAILYNCRRTATITSTETVTLWSLERTLFQMVVKSVGRSKEQERFETLSGVKDLRTLSEEKLRKIADCLEEETFDDSQCVIKQGTTGDLFYIIRSGEVRITKDMQAGGEEEVARYGKGRYFGEIALIKEDIRMANVYAVGVVKCYTLDRTAFTNLVGDISDPNHEENIEEELRPTKIINQQIARVSLDQLQIIKPLGAGGFGMVKLVSVEGVPDRAFALKCIQKARVVQYGQQRHIMDEKNILMQIDSPFLLGLHKTFKDNKFVYLLTDAYLGGDLWRLLHTKGPFNDTNARFYVGCVLEAFAYLHKRQYVYRDLKPENLMIDNKGYVKVVDLGFAKKVLPGHKTWTFCGTPEYIPPEIISNTGHNVAADYWSLGILVYELLSKRTPFRAKDDLAIYEGILRGIHSVQFPYKISRKAENLVKALCRQEPSERIGYQKAGIGDIRKHRWFQGFDWEGLQQVKVVAPHVPDIKNAFDMSNFEKIKEEDLSKIPDEMSGWDAEF